MTNRIGFGLYDGKLQYYIKGVDGNLAQLGSVRPKSKYLKEIIDYADKQNRILVRNHDREMKNMKKYEK